MTKSQSKYESSKVRPLKKLHKEFDYKSAKAA